MDFEGIGRVAANTTLAACAGGLVAVLFVYPTVEEVGPRHLGQRLPRRPRRHHLPLLLGVARPARSSSVRSPAIVVPLGVDLIEWLRIDDPIGAVAVHGFVRHLGHAQPRACSPPASSASRRPTAPTRRPSVKGLFYGGGIDQLMAQFIGSLTCVIVVSAVSLVVMFAIKRSTAAWNLRVSRRGRARGPRHPRARHARLPHGVRAGRQLQLAHRRPGALEVQWNGQSPSHVRNRTGLELAGGDPWCISSRQSSSPTASRR